MDRFESKVDRGSGPDTCHVWTAAKLRTGYGVFSLEGRPQRAHRIAWQLVHGPIPKGLHVCHHCDNPPCVNVRHLFLGTDKDNSDDRAMKGRSRPLKGSRAPSAKLKETDIPRIRALYQTGEFSHRSLAKMFGVSHMAIGDVLRHKQWGHVCI